MNSLANHIIEEEHHINMASYAPLESLKLADQPKLDSDFTKGRFNGKVIFDF